MSYHIPTSPTSRTYTAFDHAYNFLNGELFGSELPPCLITFQRKSKTRGYFCGDAFTDFSVGATTDEIAMNPQTFENRTQKQILSTLAHEMTHLWQHHFGEAKRDRYHNKEWAAKMEEIGLMPSHTGEEGGRKTGQSVTHYIIEGGLFDAAADVLIADNWSAEYFDKPAENAEKKAASKTKYACPYCKTNAWAKPETKLVCGMCNQVMVDPKASLDGGLLGR